ncbi:Uncharacterised protein [uncultured archaeon]|nr:Uncharacterised protein [uncultured archaeon]
MSHFKLAAILLLVLLAAGCLTIKYVPDANETAIKKTTTSSPTLTSTTTLPNENTLPPKPKPTLPPKPRPTTTTSILPAKNETALSSCPTEWPLNCTTDYSPVCARLEGGGHLKLGVGRWETFNNSCMACASSSRMFIISNYKQGGCQGDEGVIVDGKAWVAVEPIQCGMNVWEKWYTAQQNKSDDIGEAGILKQFFLTNYNATVYAVKSIKKYEEVCMSCGCSRGDELRLLVDFKDFDLYKKMEFKLTAAESVCAVRNLSACVNDSDCVCGGKDVLTGACFIGNDAYRRDCVDMASFCPDFCAGIAGNLRTACVEGRCAQKPK